VAWPYAALHYMQTVQERTVSSRMKKANKEDYENISSQYKRVVKEMALDTTDTFTRAMAMMFAFHDAHIEKCAALERCQAEVHKLRDELAEEARDHLDLLSVNRRLQDDLQAWHSAAMSVGEYMNSVGPDNYYKFTSEQWKKWAIAILTDNITGK